MTASGRGRTDIVVGPVHAGIIEPGRFTFNTFGETIASLDVQLGFSHRGIEHVLAGMPATDAAPRIARICGACSVARSWAYARALEGLAGVQLDGHSEFVRLIVAELERIYNHLFDIGSTCAGAGYGFGRTTALGLKERVHRVCAELSGHRFLFDAIVPGGVRSGMCIEPDRARRELMAVRDGVERLIADILGNSSVYHRFEGTGRVTLQTAREVRAVGPALRASGDGVDTRVQNRYGAYEHITPQVVVETCGDVLARFRVKVGELRESLRLAMYGLEQVHFWPSYGPQPLRPEAGTMIGIVEGARGVESVIVECDAHGVLRNVRVTSASARNWPLIARAMEGNIVPDFPLVAKSFNLCYACVDK